VDKGKMFDGILIKPSFTYFADSHSSNKVLWLGYGLCMVTYTLCWAYIRKKTHIRFPISKKWRDLIDLYTEADLIIPVGGGYLMTNRRFGSIYRLGLLLHPLLLSKILLKPTVLYSQSVGPFYRKIDKWMLATTLKKTANLVIIREGISMELLKSMGVTNCVRSIDAGFLLTSNHKATGRAKLHTPTRSIAIGVTARKWLAASDQRAYEKAMAETLDYLVHKHGAYVVFIPQVTAEFHGDDDRIVSEAIFSEMTEKEHALVLTENFGYREIKTIYDQLDFILGTRFHSVIFSLTSYVPAMAIEYEHKTSGIMQELGLSQWVIKIEDVNPEALKYKMSNLIKKQASYKAHLHQVLPQYVKQAHNAIEFVDQAYQASLN
jgi:colanic acid/amylovoran biosynthesis protein